MSFDSPEDAIRNGTTVIPPSKTTLGVTFLAASGDLGAPGGYPAYSPDVVSVGGTALTLSGGGYGSEAGWSGSGGGIGRIRIAACKLSAGSDDLQRKRHRQLGRYAHEPRRGLRRRAKFRRRGLRFLRWRVEPLVSSLRQSWHPPGPD